MIREMSKRFLRERQRRGAGGHDVWGAAHATDVPAMTLLLEHGADPDLPTIKVPRRSFGGDGDDTDPSGLPPVPIGGPRGPSHPCGRRRRLRSGANSGQRGEPRCQ